MAAKYVLPILAIFLGLGTRLFLAHYYHGNDDQISYEIVSAILERGGNVYSETQRYNYSPLWAQLLLYLKSLSNLTNLPFHSIIRGFLSLVDLLNGVFIGLISSQIFTNRSSTSGFSLYLLNPVSLLIVGYHGQFDNLAALPLLVATYWYIRTNDKSSIVPIWLLGTLAVIIKHTTVFGALTLFVLTARNHRHAWIMFLLTLIVFLGSFFVYFPEGQAGIINNVFLYRSKPDQYGLGELLPDYLSAPIFFILMMLVPFIAKHYLKLSLAQGLLFAFVAFITLTYGIAEQYFILPILWGSILPGAWYWGFTLVATIFLIGSPNNLDIPYIPAVWNTVWLAASGWLLSYFLTWRTGPKVSKGHRDLCHD